MSKEPSVQVLAVVLTVGDDDARFTAVQVAGNMAAAYLHVLRTTKRRDRSVVVREAVDEWIERLKKIADGEED